MIIILNIQSNKSIVSVRYSMNVHGNKKTPPGIGMPGRCYKDDDMSINSLIQDRADIAP